MKKIIILLLTISICLCSCNEQIRTRVYGGEMTINLPAGQELMMVMCERMPDIMSGAMGNQMYTVRLKTEEEKDEFIRFVHEKIQ